MGCVARTVQHKMKPRKGWWALALAMLLCAAGPAGATDIVIYSFEGSLEGWVIPDWAKNSADYVGSELKGSQEQASDGECALELHAAFPGGKWTGAYVERELDVTDWSQFAVLEAQVYLPSHAPAGLQGKIIATVGDQWVWTEMNHSVLLEPGKWTPITVNLKPGSMDWKFFPDDNFRKSIRKIGVRVESNQQPAYTGPVYIDAIRLAE